MEISYRFNIKPGKAGAFVEWTKKLEANPPKAPDGWTYKTTQLVVQGFGDHDAEVRWEIDDYAALGSSNGSAEWDEANREFFSEFLDERFRYSNTLSKSADDVHVPEGF